MQYENLNDREVMQRAKEKIKVQSLMGRNSQLSDCDTRWKAEVRCNQAKQPIEYFAKFFADKVRQVFCSETILYSV